MIADIVGSREISPRAGFQSGLETLLSEINGLSADRLLSPYTITIGDEFQAVYVDFQTVFRDVARIVWAVHPHRIRFAVNYDLITTALNRTLAVGMDGPAFHGAREQLDSLKQKSTTSIRVAGLASRSLDLVNAALDLFCDDLNRWSRTALGLLAHSLDGLSVAQMEELLGVKRRAVYKALNVNNIDHHITLLQAITAELQAEVGD